MRRFSALVTTSMLAACTVGPTYKKPPAAASDAVARGTFVRATDTTLVPGPGLARWWEALGDPTLSGLVYDALAHSPSIDEATARIRAAEAQLKRQRAAQLPSLSANGTYLHAELSGINIGQSASADAGTAQPTSSAASTALDFYNLGLNASWEIDLFGGGRRRVEQSRATVGARVADLADAQVSLASKVAEAYVNVRDMQARIRLNAASIMLQRRQFSLAGQRYAGGTVSMIDVERLRNQLETSEADAIPLGAQRDEYLNQLALLTGRTPGVLDATLSTIVPVPLPPATVPISDPAALIAHRPDVRSAERQLAASYAAIGVSKAKELPGIRLMGILGLGGTNPGDVFDPGKLTTLVAPMLSWSFLDFGKNRAATRTSEAQRDLADATYRRTVLEALQDAETAVSAFGNARAQFGQRARVEATAARAAGLNAQRVRAGTSSVIDQLDIERQQLSAAIATEQARAQLTKSYIMVNKALGLGWSAAPSAMP